MKWQETTGRQTWYKYLTRAMEHVNNTSLNLQRIGNHKLFVSSHNQVKRSLGVILNMGWYERLTHKLTQCNLYTACALGCVCVCVDGSSMMQLHRAAALLITPHHIVICSTCLMAYVRCAWSYPILSLPISLSTRAFLYHFTPNILLTTFTSCKNGLQELIKIMSTWA